MVKSRETIYTDIKEDTQIRLGMILVQQWSVGQPEKINGLKIFDENTRLRLAALIIIECYLGQWW